MFYQTSVVHEGSREGVWHLFHWPTSLHTDHAVQLVRRPIYLTLVDARGRTLNDNLQYVVASDIGWTELLRYGRYVLLP